MFYDAVANTHGLKHDPMKALVAPRPIGWISSLDKDGRANLAPYSFFNLLATTPTLVGFSSGNIKDSQNNIQATGDFVCNIASAHLIDQVNASAAPVPAGDDEFEIAGLGKADSQLVAAPRVAEALVHLECRYVQSVPLLTDPMPWTLIIGRVVGVHIDDSLIENGMVDVQKINPLSRLGYLDYGVLGEVVAKPRP